MVSLKELFYYIIHARTNRNSLIMSPRDFLVFEGLQYILTPKPMDTEKKSILVINIHLYIFVCCSFFDNKTA